MVARIHFDLERTVAKYRLIEKLREGSQRSVTTFSESSGADESTSMPRNDLPDTGNHDRLADIERRLSKRLLI